MGAPADDIDEVYASLNRRAANLCEQSKGEADAEAAAEAAEFSCLSFGDEATPERDAAPPKRASFADALVG